MNRSKWKGPYLNPDNIDKINSTTNKKKLNLLTASRNHEIIPKFVGLNFKVQNGKNYSEINVTDDMIGHKFGEFAFTRGRFSFKKKSKK